MIHSLVFGWSLSQWQKATIYFNLVNRSARPFELSIRAWNQAVSEALGGDPTGTLAAMQRIADFWWSRRIDAPGEVAIEAAK